MNNPVAISPTTRSWKDIPQAVNSDAMRGRGRWRRFVSALGLAGMMVTGFGVVAGAWMVYNQLQAPQTPPSASARPAPIRTIELITDGTLDHEWLVRALEISPKTTLEEVNLEELRVRLMAEGQVLSASLKRKLPDVLVVHITERTPMARLKTNWRGVPTELMVARDGVAFEGAGYDQHMVNLLPWLAGFTLIPQGNAFKPIAGMDVVSELLTKAQLEAEHLYRTWYVVSLDRVAFDRKIEVRTRTPQHAKIVFNANEDFFRQLAYLNSIWERMVREPSFDARIDLSLGSRVPVTFAPLRLVVDAPRGGNPATNFPALRIPPTNFKREL